MRSISSSTGKPIASVQSWDAAFAVQRLMGGLPIEGTNMIWSDTVIMPVPRKNVLLMSLEDLQGSD